MCDYTDYVDEYAYFNNIPWSISVNSDPTVAPVIASERLNADSTSTVTHAVQEPLLTIAELLDAMEALVERIESLEERVAENEAVPPAKPSPVDDVLAESNKALEKTVTTLSERHSNLEQRVDILEQFSREWVNPNTLSKFIVHFTSKTFTALI